MMTPCRPKTPMQMRREAWLRANPIKPRPPAGPVDPSQRPRLQAEPRVERWS